MHVINVNQRMRVVEVAYHGLVNASERTTAIDVVDERLEEFAYTRVLLDFSNAIVAIDDFDASKGHARKLSDMIHCRGCRIAYLSEPGARVNRVIETLIAARGLGFESFDDRAAAVHWLLSSGSRAGNGNGAPPWHHAMFHGVVH